MVGVLHRVIDLVLCFGREFLERVHFLGFRGKVCCRLADIELAGHNISEQSNTIFVQKLDLPADRSDCDLQAVSIPADLVLDPLLLSWRWNGDFEVSDVPARKGTFCATRGFADSAKLRIRRDESTVKVFGQNCVGTRRDVRKAD